MPSSSVPAYLPYDKSYVRAIAHVARESQASLLVGSSGREKLQNPVQDAKRVANSAFLFSPAGDIVGRYDKILLLPFDEYLPFRGVVPWPSWLANPAVFDFEPGQETMLFNVRDARFSVLICWENLFTELFRATAGRGVDFIVSMTNEARPAARGTTRCWP